jgi:hypothetical protein
MTFKRNSTHYKRRLKLWLAVFGFIALSVCVGLTTISGNVEASEFENRSLYVETPIAGSVVAYEFSFEYTPPTPVGSIKFLFCDTPLPTQPCNIPAGLDVGAAALSSQTGEIGFAILSQSQNEIVLTRPSQVTVSGASTYIFGNITNPSGENQVVFVRLSSYTSTDGTGIKIDEGAVATTTVPDVEIYTQVPPILIFCVATVVNDSECTDLSGNYADLGELRSTQTSYFTNQMQARTNARSGYTIQMTGNTLTSGIHSIPALAVPTGSFVGVGQFGMNIAANSNPPIGSAPSGPGLNAIINPSYTTPDLFAYNNGDVLVSSTNPTRSRKFTMSYIVNVPAGQAYGVYSTTITYVCIGSF